MTRHLPVPLVLLLLLAACGGDDPGPDTPAGTIRWERTFGGVADDAGTSVALNADGGSILATHQTISTFNRDVYVYRLDPGGAVMWERRWGGDFLDEVYAVATFPGVVYVGGRTHHDIRAESADAFLLALSMDDGHPLWERTYGSDLGAEEVRGIAVTYEGIYLAGSISGAAGVPDILLLQVFPDGSSGWQRRLGTAAWDSADGPLLAAAGALFVAGRWNADAEGLGGDAFLGAFGQADGQLFWAHSDGNPEPSTEMGLGLALGVDRLIMAGLGSTTRSGGIRLWSFFLDGTVDWRRTWDGPGLDVARAVEVDPLDGSIVVAGSTSSLGAGSADLLLLRFRDDGVPLDTLTWGGASADQALGLALDASRLLVAGETSSIGAGGADAVLLEVQPRGEW